MTVSRLDLVYRKILLSKYFTKGWGAPENLLRLFAFRRLVSNRETCYHLVSGNTVKIINEAIWSDCKVIEGKFRSPLAQHLPDIVPPEVQDAYFQMILPLKWKSSKHRPICIHLAGTGDHFFWRRRNIMAKPLLKADIGSIILENPFYGLRKPKDQIRSRLHHVSDIFVMGGCLILECLVLLEWCEQLGFGPLGLSGLSMGGHMASLAATNWPKPIVLVPCLSWSTASGVFTKGVMSDSIDWKLLQEQYSSDSLFYDRLANLVAVIDKPDNVKSTSNCRTATITDQLKSNEVRRYSTVQISDIRNSSLQVNETHKTRQNEEEIANKPKDAIHFMKCIMDECTHLKNFSVPFETSLIIAVCAQADGYVPREGSSLEEIWPGVTMRYLNAGHVSAYIWHRKFFRNCIIEAFEKAKKMAD